MKIANALSNFLYDKKYFVTIFDNCLHIYKYQELLKLTSTVIIVKMEEFELRIVGQDLTIVQMNNEEILIMGLILDIGRTYAK